MPKTFSGKTIIKILSKQYGFREVSISGSHTKMRKEIDKKIITVIIPLHGEVFIGTFRNILRQAKIETADFYDKSKN
jgi:predicted RNA binding protein YcfA (HicA-like mRNA interferase family)